MKAVAARKAELAGPKKQSKAEKKAAKKKKK